MSAVVMMVVMMMMPAAVIAVAASDIRPVAVRTIAGIAGVDVNPPRRNVIRLGLRHHDDGRWSVFIVHRRRRLTVDASFLIDVILLDRRPAVLWLGRDIGSVRRLNDSTGESDGSRASGQR